MSEQTSRLLGIAVLLAILSTIVLAGHAGAVTITYGPYAVVSDPVPPSTTFSVKIVWRTNQASTNNTAYYRLAGSGGPWTTGTDVNFSTYHEVEFIGLAGQTTFEFKAKTDDAESLVYAFYTNPNLLRNGSFESWYYIPETDPLRAICDSGWVPDYWQPWEIWKYQEQVSTNPDHVHVSMNRPTGIPTPAARDGINRASIDEGWRSCFGGLYQTLTLKPGYYQISGWMAWMFQDNTSTLGIYAKDGEHSNPATRLRQDNLGNVAPGATVIRVESTAGFKVPAPGQTASAFLYKKGVDGDPNAYGDSFTYTGLTATSFTGVSGVDFSHAFNNPDENQVRQAPEIWSGIGPPDDKWQPVYVKTGPGQQTDWAYGEKIVYCASGKLTVFCNLKSQSWAGLCTSHYDGLRVTAALEPVSITDIEVRKGLNPSNPDTEVTIAWETNVATATYLEYGLTSSYGTVIQDPTPVYSHSVTLTGLQARTLYHFQIIAPAAGGHPTGYSGNQMFYTPIQFSNYVENRAVSGSGNTYDYTIGFDTDVAVKSVVKWGKTLGYEMGTLDAGSGNTHQVVISGIVPGQTFYWQACANSDLNPAYQPVNSPACDAGHRIDPPKVEITNVVASPDFDTGDPCRVNWDTNINTSVNKVYYRVVGQTQWLVAVDPEAGGSHSVLLTGLQIDAQYEYYCESGSPTLVPGKSDIKYFYTFVPKNGINNPGFETGDLSGWRTYQFYGASYGQGSNAGLPGTPEVRSRWILTPTTNPHGGSYSCGMDSLGLTKNGGVLQKFYPIGNSTYRSVSVWVIGLCLTYDGKLTLQTQDNAMVRIGVDPTGGIDRDSPNVVWTPWTDTKLWWHQLKLGFVPQPGLATLFIEGTQLYPIGPVVTCWDDVELGTTLPVQLLSQPTVQVPGDQASPDSTARITWQTNVPSTTQIKWDTDGPPYANATPIDAGLTTNHTVLLRGIDSDKLIHFQVVSTAPGYDSLESADRLFQSMPTAGELLNGSFEGTGLPGRSQLWPWEIYTVDVKTFYGNPQLPDGGGIDGLITGRPYGGSAWYGVTCEPDGGSSFVGAASQWSPGKNGGVWQRIATTPGQTYGLAMRIITHQVGGSPGDTECWLGVDLTGGTDPASPNVTWARGYSAVDNTWTTLANAFTATGNVATIFCHLKAWWALEWHVAAVDKVGFMKRVESIDAAKLADDGVPVDVTGVVTATFVDDLAMPICFAIEEPQRFSGIRVLSTEYVNPGDTVRVAGSTATVSGERVIQATSVRIVPGAGTVPAAFSIMSIDSGGGTYGGQGAVVNDATIYPPKMCVGTNNVGILMKLRGKVRAVLQANPGAPSFSDCFYLDDAYGSSLLGFETGLKDGSGNIGIRCRPATDPVWGIPQLPQVGQYVEVTGVMGVRQIKGINARYFWTTEIAPAATTSVNKGYVAKWNLLSLRNQPVNPDPAVVFGGEDVIDGRLYAWDGPTQGLLLYDIWSPDAFGALSSSVGYWLNAAKAGNISYTGYVDSTPLDRWISAPKGWKIIGMPFSRNTAWANWKVTDGTSMKSLYDASQYGAGWLESVGYWWDAQNQGLKDFGLPDDFPSTEELQPWHGYWVKLKKNVGLVAPAPPLAE